MLAVSVISQLSWSCPATSSACLQGAAINQTSTSRNTCVGPWDLDQKTICFLSSTCIASYILRLFMHHGFTRRVVATSGYDHLHWHDHLHWQNHTLLIHFWTPLLPPGSLLQDVAVVSCLLPHLLAGYWMYNLEVSLSLFLLRKVLQFLMTFWLQWSKGPQTWRSAALIDVLSPLTFTAWLTPVK